MAYAEELGLETNSFNNCLFVDKYRNPQDIPDLIMPYLNDVSESKLKK